MADPVERLQAALLTFTCELGRRLSPDELHAVAMPLRELAQGIDDVAEELAELRRSA